MLCGKRKYPVLFRWIAAVLLTAFAFRGAILPAAAQTQVYRSVETDSRKVALTFDDGPHPILTPRILDILDRYHAHATFFMVGENVGYYPDAARDVIARGNEVGNHTFSHNHLQKMTESSLAREIERCEDVLEELCEYRPHLFRPPEGVTNGCVRHCSERGDYTMILWSIDTRDWEKKNAGAIVETVMTQIRPGDIILFHDYIGTKSKTPEALEILLPKLLAHGFEPVTVSELLGIA